MGEMMDLNFLVKIGWFSWFDKFRSLNHNISIRRGGGSSYNILIENSKIFDFHAVLFRKLKNQKSAIFAPFFSEIVPKFRDSHAFIP